MKKVCPRCGATFECRNDDILTCQCVNIRLTHKQRAFIGKIYDNCLCHDCLLTMSKMSEAELAWMAFKRERHLQ